ncbi:MAG: thiamine-phosphate kinase [Gemmatimonadota bacterium]
MGRTVRLGRGGEFDLIRRLAEEGSLPPEVMIGPGDDGAVLAGGWVVSTDLSIEGVHFERAWITNEEVGFRAAAAAVSDLAAMAADPVGLLVSCAAAPNGEVDVEAVQTGIRALAQSVGACVIGGDLSRSPGPLILDVVAIGRADWPVQRDGAEPGDHVWVTGRLGGAAAAVRAWTSGAAPSATARAAFARPSPRVAEARCLVEQEAVDAMIDLSDGLAGDAAHIAAASGVSITLEATRLPIGEGLEGLGRDVALDLALHGGEDYELCFVTDPGAVDADGFRARFGVEVTRVGTVGEGEGVWLVDDEGPARRLERGGFDHWAVEGTT